jgi:aminoglycoside phosphotransferase (APT) family kinase protein
MTSETLSRFRKIAEGREAELFEWADGTVLRLLRDASRVDQTAREAAALAAAGSRGVPVPAVHELLTVEGRPGMVMERVDGPDLLTLVGKQPWRLFGLARLSGELHARLNSVTAPRAMPSVKERARTRIRPTERLPQHLAEFALAALEGLDDGEALCHGDYHPANIIAGSNGPVVIDWTAVARGAPEADVARTLVILRFGVPPPGTSAVVRGLALVGRRLLTNLYLRAYRKARPLDMPLVERWLVPRAAERLAAEVIEGEEGPIGAFLESAAAKR